MKALEWHEFHERLKARFTEVNGMEVVSDYGDPLAEYEALCARAGVMDLSCRGRLFLGGADRQRFLNGQVTNSVKDLRPGEGCYAALVTAKGKMQSDLNVYCLPDRLLVDFEPGLSAALLQRFEKYIIADDVQLSDAAPAFGLLTVQGPESGPVIRKLGVGITLPERPQCFCTVTDAAFGEIHCVNQPRGVAPGFDLFTPIPALGAVLGKLITAVRAVGGRPAGWQALEMVRIEAGIPRFGVDMDETNLPPEAGIEARAVNYSKGCYIGQEVIARIRTYGQVAKALRGLRLPDDLKELPKRGDKLFHGGKEAGYVTSAVASPALKANLALGYVRREHNQAGTRLTLRSPAGESAVTIVPLPFTGAAQEFEICH